MDNIPEREQPKEPRIGVAPFPPGIEIEDKGAVIKSKPISLRPIGEVRVVLYSPLHNDLEFEEIETEEMEGRGQQAFTIDLSGKTIRGKLTDFLKQGYYQVSIDKPRYDHPDIDLQQYLKANIWLDGTDSVVSSSFEAFSKGGEKAWFNQLVRSDTKTRPRILIHEQFMLPNIPEILQAVRLNITSDEE